MLNRIMNFYGTIISKICVSGSGKLHGMDLYLLVTWNFGHDFKAFKL